MVDTDEKNRLDLMALSHVIDHHPEKIEVIEVTPRDIHDLKAWLGIPNGRVAPDKCVGMLRSVTSHHLPTTSFEYADLSPEQQQAVHDHAYNLLFGEVSDADLAEPVTAATIKHMLATATPLRVTVGDNLTVSNGQVYSLTTPTASFNTVTIIGSGSIRLSGDTKVTCGTLVYQDA